MSLAVDRLRTAEPDARAVPATVSARRQLRDGLPEIYRLPDGTRENLGMRFLHALEEVLDPVVATLDGLLPHFSPDIAPDHVLTGLAAWLGVDEVEGLAAGQLREAVLSAGELARLRGTRRGLKRALALFFPHLPVTIVDHGRVVVLERRQTPPTSPEVAFEVFVRRAVPNEATRAAVAGCIDRWKPANARYVLRFKAGEEPGAP